MTFAETFGSIIALLFLSFFLFGIYLLFQMINKKRLLKNYDAEKNISRRTSEGERGYAGRDTGFKKAKPLDAGLDESPKPELLPTTEVSNDGKGSDSSGKDSGGIRKLRRRFKKR